LNRKGIGEAEVMAFFKIISKHSHSRTKVNHGNLRTEPDISGIHVGILTA
jgi:hypothetical protein